MCEIERPRIFFLHFNKTAGTSLYRYLESHYSTDEYIPDIEIPTFQHAKFEREAFIRRLARFRLVTKLHLNYVYLQELRAIEPEFQAVTVYREPIERAFSQIEAWRRVPPEVLERVQPERLELLLDARKLPVEAFVAKHRERLTNRQAKMTAGVEQTEPVSDNSALVDQALEALASIEFVGLTSRLADLALLLSWNLGFYNGFNLHKLNAARREHKLSDDERRSILPTITEINAADLRVYAEAERRLFNQLSDTKNSMFRAGGRAPEPQPLSASKHFCQTMEEPLFGEGWHERESGVHSTARWAGPDRLSSVYLSVIADTTCRVRLKVTSVIAPAILQELVIWVNDQALPFEVRQEEGLLVLETAPVMPAEQESMKVVLESPFSDSAESLYGVPDQRRKTLAIERIEVTSAECFPQ